MTRDDFERMWGVDPQDSTPNGCLVLIAVTVAVWLVIGVGIWWAVVR